MATAFSNVRRPVQGRQRPNSAHQNSYAAQALAGRCTEYVNATPVLTLTFDRPVLLRGTPLNLRVGVLGATRSPVSAVQNSDTEIAVTFDGVTTGGFIWLVNLEPNIRTVGGGFVTFDGGKLAS